jgi:hypothetical protein
MSLMHIVKYDAVSLSECFPTLQRHAVLGLPAGKRYI